MTMLLSWMNSREVARVIIVTRLKFSCCFCVVEEVKRSVCGCKRQKVVHVYISAINRSKEAFLALLLVATGGAGKYKYSKDVR